MPTKTKNRSLDLDLYIVADRQGIKIYRDEEPKWVNGFDRYEGNEIANLGDVVQYHHINKLTIGKAGKVKVSFSKREALKGSENVR